MLTSDLICKIRGYLGCRGEVGKETDELIGTCFARLVPKCSFRYTYAVFSPPPAFLSHPAYERIIKGAKSAALVVTTLGSGPDELIRYLTKADLTAAVVTDACASAYLESLADDFEERTFGPNRTFRFCPGYGGSDLNDTDRIFELVPPEKIGVSRLRSGYMVPSKSMAGIIGLGRRAEKTCEGCSAIGGCTIRKEGGTCYSAKK